MKHSELKQLIKEEIRSTLTEEKKYLNDMSYEELLALRKRMDFKKASREEKKYVKDLIDKKKPLSEDSEDRYTDKEMLQRTTAGEFPEYFTILDIIERYKEYVVGHLRSEGELNENEQFPDTSLTNALKIHFQVAYEKGLEAQPEDDYDSFDEKYWKNNEFEIKDTIRKYFRFPMKESGTLNEDKGDELANKVIMRFRKALRNLNDDEVYSFREKIAMAIDAKLK